MATIIIPAHNEATVIERCIDSVIGQDQADTIIVACNGCTDNTVELVRNKYPTIICLDIEKASKTNALNVAEEHITSYPIFYLDADTQLGQGDVAKISAHFENNTTLLAAPTPNINTDNSSWLVKQYYKVWLKLPYISDGVIGTCSFIMNKEGRARFDSFPDIINDDGYVRCCFESTERQNIANTTIHIQAPKDLYSLIKIKSRARLGNMQLNHLKLCHKPKEANYRSSLSEKLFSKQFIATSVYIAIALLIRMRAKSQLNNIDSYTWEKDLSSR